MLSTGHVYMILIGWLQERLFAQHQSDNWQPALADCPIDVDTVLSAGLNRHETCNLAGGGFCEKVEIRLDPDSWIGYLSILSCTPNKM